MGATYSLRGTTTTEEVMNRAGMFAACDGHFFSSQSKPTHRQGVALPAAPPGAPADMEAESLDFDDVFPCKHATQYPGDLDWRAD